MKVEKDFYFFWQETKLGRKKNYWFRTSYFSKPHHFKIFSFFNTLTINHWTFSLDCNLQICIWKKNEFILETLMKYFHPWLSTKMDKIYFGKLAEPSIALSDFFAVGLLKTSRCCTPWVECSGVLHPSFTMCFFRIFLNSFTTLPSEKSCTQEHWLSSLFIQISQIHSE